MLIQRNALKQINKWIALKKILILSGARQVGKTTILKNIKQELENKKKICIYLNLESFQIADQLNKNPDNLFNFLPEKYTQDSNNTFYFFIDEIQILDTPSRFLKYIYDSYENIKLIVTESANLEIKTKLADSLVGRKISFPINPLTIKEILQYKNLNQNTKNPIEQQKIEKIFEEYLIFGGLPEVYLEKNKDNKKKCSKNILAPM